jgi:hypothetical protein
LVNIQPQKLRKIENSFKTQLILSTQKAGKYLVYLSCNFVIYIIKTRILIISTFGFDKAFGKTSYNNTKNSKIFLYYAFFKQKNYT